MEALVALPLILIVIVAPAIRSLWTERQAWRPSGSLPLVNEEQARANGRPLPGGYLGRVDGGSRRNNPIWED